ncbi:MAG: flagellar motor protein MotB [Alphaproteobacteria bacterium]
MSDDVLPPFESAGEVPFPVPQEDIEYVRKTLTFHEYREDPKSLWLISFTDLVGVMLAFFVLMYSMSSPREDKWVEISTSLEEGVTDSSPYKGAEWNAGADETIALQKMDVSRGLNTRYLRAVLNEMIRADKRLEKITLRRTGNQVALVLPDEMLTAGKISEEGAVTLAAVADLLRRISNRVEIMANVDEASARRTRVNGWEIALSRAALVGGALQAEGYERLLSLHAAPLAQADSATETTVIITPDDGSPARSLQVENTGSS